MIRLSTIRLCGFAATALAVAAAALPAPSLAASGTAKLVLDGPAANALREQGVRIEALKPASGSGQQVSLPVSTGLAGASTTLLRQRGGISFLAPGGKRASLTRLSLLLGQGSRLTARLGGEDLDLFTVLPGGRRQIDPLAGTVRLADLRLKLTRDGALALADRLGLERVRPKRFATLGANAAGLTVTGASGGGSASPGGPAQQSSACPLPSAAGPEAEAAPPVSVKPPGALDVSGASIAWRVRESFIRYIATGEGTSVSGGASADPPELLPSTSTALSYGFHFPFSDGWLDPGVNLADAADDRAALHFSGALRFRYGGHGIDLATANPEIEIAGGSSRAIFSVSDNGGAPKRQVLFNLDLSRAGAIARSGNTYTYERVPGVVPAGTASSTFAGFYAPGTDFGCVSVSFTTTG